MDSTDALPDGLDVPGDRPVSELDVRNSPPPEPLTRTLDRLAKLDGDAVLLQRNDRAPQHLFPKLAERGYRHETVERDGTVLTAIWRP